MSSIVSLNDLPAAPNGRTGWPWTEPAVEPSLPPAPAAAWPLITIVTPSYNQARYLEETIRSVLLQGYPNLEYIVIDGGSTDESVDIIRKYAPWLDHWVSEPDRGQSQAINKGFARAQGELLAWLNSDDTYLPGALAAVAACPAQQTDVALIYGQALCMDKDSVLAGDVLARPYDYQTLLNQSNFVPQASAFFRHKAFTAVGGLNEELHFCMDYDLWLRLHDFGGAVFLAQPLSGMRMYPETKTGSADRRMFVEVRQMIERHGGHGLPSAFEHWLLATRVPKAFEDFRLGQVEAGRDELGYVVRNVPAWQSNSEPIIKEIVRQAWQQAPGLADEDQPVIAFADLVCRHLPVELTAHRSVRRQVLARLSEGLAVRNDRLGQFAAARRYVGQAFQHDPRLAQKKWLWGTFSRGWIPTTIPRSSTRGLRPGPDLRRKLLASLPIGSTTTVSGPTPRRLLDSCVMAVIVGLLDGWDMVQPGAKTRWTAELRAAQDTTSRLFVDPRQTRAAANDLALGQTYDDWLTAYLVLSALDMLQAEPCQPLALNLALKTPAAVRQWLISLDWVSPEWSISLDWSHPWLSNCAQVMFLLSFLLREANRTHDPAFQATAQAIFDWLDERQDPISGFWGMSRGKYRIVNTIMAGHFVPLYIAFGRPLQHMPRLIDTTLSMQAVNGLVSPNGAPSPCATQAAMDLLVRLSLLTDYRAPAIKVALTQAMRAMVGQLEPLISSLSTGLRVSNPAEEPAGHWLANSQLAAMWLYLVALGLINQRYPGDLPDGMGWQFPPPPSLGWPQPNTCSP